MKSIITFLSIICISIHTHALADTTHNTQAIDLFPFYDSAHHWYDINDQDKIITPLPDQKKYLPAQIVEIADNILLFQKNNGGWAKNYDMQAILTDEQRAAVLAAKADTNTCFDNGATHSHVAYLAEVYHQTHLNRFRDGCLRGLQFMLDAQYPNGGYPQFYPDTSGYRKYITFNDGAMSGNLTVFQDIIMKKPQYAFVQSDLRRKIKKAFDKGIECILKTQIIDNGETLVWCQQHDNITLLPQSARTFEPASICNDESCDILTLLMNMPKPNRRIINAVQAGVKWLKRSAIRGIRVDTISAPEAVYMYHRTKIDKIVVQDSTAPQIWPRYNELGTHRPLFSNRDWKIVYSLAEVDRERRTGYSWYVYFPQAILDAYPAWQKKYAPRRNVLNE